MSSDTEENTPLENQPVETLKFNFNIESLAVVLYRDHPEQVGDHRSLCGFGPSDLNLGLVPVLQRSLLQHQDTFRLAQLTFHLLRSGGRIASDGSLELTTVLTDCTLDDLRTGIERVTSR